MKQPVSDSAQTRLADELGISRATVSKTIRHCSGVDSRMRLKILRAARDADLLSPQGFCDIYCILPDTPNFFWGEMRRGISDAIHALPDPLQIKFNVISSLHDTEVIELYLDEAAAMHAKVLVLAIAATDAIRARLTEYASQSGTMVLLLSEYHSIVNSFTLVGLSLGSLAVASVYDATGTYRFAWVMLLVLTAVTLVSWVGAVLLARRYR